jgi:ATP-dependent Clp protease protease subunit
MSAPLSAEDWVRTRLFDQRTVVIRGELSHEVVGQAAAELMTLDAGGDETVHVHVDAHGGTYDTAFTLIDVIDLLGVPVVATCVGRAEGPVVGVLAVADRRLATPHARLRLREPDGSFHGRASELEGWLEVQESLRQRFCERLATVTRRSTATVADALRSGRYLDVDEAIRFGLLDEVARRGGEVRSLPGQGFGFRSR